MVHYHKPECHGKMSCKKGGLLSSRSKWGCIIISQSAMEKCHAKRVVCYLQDQSENDSLHNQNVAFSAICYELLILLQPGWVWWYIIIIFCKDLTGVSQPGLKMSKLVCGNSIFRTMGVFVARLSMVVHHHKPDHCAKNGFAVFMVSPFTAMLATSSLRKQPIKVPNLKSLRLFFLTPLNEYMKGFLSKCAVLKVDLL